MYFITVLENVNEWPNLGDQRTWGYYPTFEQAHSAVVNNVTDIQEGCYGYALIEHIDPGICSYAEQIQWYKWDEVNKLFVEIDQPKTMKHICNFAIG